MGRSQAKSSERVCTAPAKENICAIIVTYSPDAHFGERLDRIHRQVGKTIIVDNTGDADPGASLQPINLADIEIIRNHENVGIAEALNQGISRAKQLGYAWTITFDQDSWIHSDLVDALVGIYEQQARPELVGIIGCNYEDEGTHTLAIKSLSSGPNFRETEAVVTSGSLLCVATFSKVGPFRSDFFIDFVDYEYCLRLLQLGYKIIISTAPLMVHALGTPTPFSLDSGVGGMSLVLTNRSPLRRYYMTRNALLVAREYFAVAPKWVLRSMASVLGFALLKIPLEKNARRKKLCATMYGALDALRSKTGKVEARWLKE
jgi:rhamnosyltransferase